MVYEDVAHIGRMSPHTTGVGGGSAAADSRGVRVKRCTASTRPTSQHSEIHFVHYLDKKFLRLFVAFVPLLWFTLKETDFEKVLMQRFPILEDWRGHRAAHAHSIGC